MSNLLRPANERQWKNNSRNGDRYLMVTFGVGCALDSSHLSAILRPALVASRNFICMVHDPAHAESRVPCEYDRIHYHALSTYTAEYPKNDPIWAGSVKKAVEEFDNIVADEFNQEFDSPPEKRSRDFTTPWYKYMASAWPRSAMVYMRLPGKEVAFSNLKSGSDFELLWNSIDSSEVLKLEETKIKQRKEGFKVLDDLGFLQEIIKKNHARIKSVNDIQAFIPTVPVTAFEHQFRKIFMRNNYQQLATKALDLYQLSTLNKTVQQLGEDWYNDYGVNENEDYNSLEKSLEIMTKWCAGNNLDLAKFREQFYNILDFKERKVNCLYLEGGSNAGKSYVVRSASDLCRNFGMSCGNVDSAFVFQNMVGKRVAIFEELLIGPGSVDSFKKFFEGTGLYVKVKAKPDAYINKIPIFITTNKPIDALLPVFPEDKIALENRMIKYTSLVPQSFLKEDGKKWLNPLWIFTDAQLNLIKTPFLP